MRQINQKTTGVSGKSLLKTIWDSGLSPDSAEASAGRRNQRPTLIYNVSDCSVFAAASVSGSPFTISSSCLGFMSFWTRLCLFSSCFLRRFSSFFLFSLLNIPACLPNFFSLFSLLISFHYNTGCSLNVRGALFSRVSILNAPFVSAAS